MLNACSVNSSSSPRRTARRRSPGYPRAAAACGAAAAAAASLALTGTGWADTSPDEIRARFSEAYYAAATGAELTARRDDAELRDYALYPYLEAERIAKALSLIDDAASTEHDAAAAAFLERHDDEPVAEGLMRAWLESLARRGRSAALVERYRPDVATTRLECQWLAARIDTGALEGLARAILERWRTPVQLPIECERPFVWLRGEGLLDDDETERRVRLLLENSRPAFARVIAGRLPEQRAAPWLGWADLISSPQATIDTLTADPMLTVEFDALLDGYSRLARDDPDAAVARHERIVTARALDDGEASLLTRALAHGLAWDRDGRALDYFARIDPEHVDDYTLAWHTRAALWARDWRLVEASIERMSDGLRQAPAWRYWAARAAAARGRGRRARMLYESLIADDNFYSALAAARMDRRVAPNEQRLERDEDVVAAIGRLEPMVRARELRAVELPSEALREWRYGQARLDAAEQRQSVHAAAEWGWHDVAVATAARHGIFFDYGLLYPRPFDASVAAAARRTRLDGPLIYGVIRQESLYRADASSPSGALGLMQLMPETAVRAAARWNRPRPMRGELFEPATNVELGAAHLRSLVERFGRQLPVALAAYNAGPAAVDNWLPDEAVDADIWIENIPYNETRAYVRRVMWHSLVFKWLEDGRPQSAESWLEAVTRIADEDA